MNNTDFPRKFKKKKPLLCAFVAALAAGLIICFSVGTHNDGAEIGKLQGLITRTQITVPSVFRAEEPNSAVMLSWHDNIITLDTENETETLSGTLYPVLMPDTSLEYSSSDSEIAEVDNSGVITAKSPGSVEISVKNDYTGKSAKAYLQVVQPVTGFYLKKSTINVYITDTAVRLEAEIIPENASNTTIQWFSKDTNIAEVDQSGHITPVNTGMTEIVATTTDGGFTAKCFVNVINEVIKADTVTIQNKDNVTIAEGETWDAIASVLPSNARNKSVEWSSDNESAATVSQNGQIKGIAAGTATVTAKSTDGPSDSMTITVTAAEATAAPSTSSGVYQSTAQSGVTYVKYNMTLDQLVSINMSGDQPPKLNGSYTTAERASEYIDPTKFSTGAYKYQFMDLSKYNGISEQTLAAFLEGKGTLSGQAAVFIEAAKEYNVSELYLVAHACLESGYGTSTLASGVDVNGTRVYNMFGIGAYDSSAVSSGSQRAYSEGWTSPAAAIKGGAKWISENYINSTENHQNTLYKMRWNPQNPGQHMYASDAAWATTQATIMERLFSQFPEAKIYYEIPVYEGSTAAVIDDTAAMANTTQQ